MILEKYLGREKYDLFTFTNPQEALNQMEQIVPDIFLLDVEMDELNGFELCQRIRQHQILKDTPVIFITSLDDTESLAKGLSVGGTEFLNKDMNPYELNLRITNILKLCILNNEIREKNALLEQKSENYKILVRLLCHDIANPLTMQGLHMERLQAMETIKNDPNIHKSITAIARSLEQIFNIIEHVRQISAMEDGKVTLSLTPVKVSDVFEEIKFIFEERLLKKKVELEVTESPANNALVLADKTSMIHQVVANIVSNSIKFSFEGQKITLSCAEKDNRIEINIHDDGIGIPANLLADLFKAHVKTSRLGTGKEKGTGFGLPLVKSYLEKYGASISVESVTAESSPDKHGTTFTLSFRKAS